MTWNLISSCRAIRKRLAGDDSGLTFVEVIAYVVLACLVGIVVAGVLVGGLQSEAANRDRDAATASAQLVSNSIQVSIRNSSAFQAMTSKLTAKVAVGRGTSWECRSWRLTADGELQYKTSPSAIPDSDERDWTTLATGVGRTAPADPLFEKDGTRLLLRFQVKVQTATAKVSTAATARAYGTGGVAQCW